MQTTTDKYDMIAAYYQAHSDELRSYVAGRVSRKDIAEDIVQDIFMRLLVTDKMISPVTLHGLVYVMARNLIYDYWRHRRAVEEYEHYIATSAGAAGNDAHSVYSVVEVTELLERGMAYLSDKQRTIYRMNVYEGKKVSEISMELRLNYKSVENRLGSARKEIRQFMRRVMAS